MEDYGTLVLPAMLAAFARAYPRIAITMETGLARAMTGRLDRAGIAWRLACVAEGQAAVEAIATQGLAVNLVKAGTVPARLARPDAMPGLPGLPAADIRLHRAEAGAGPDARAAELLAGHLAAAFAVRSALS